MNCPKCGASVYDNRPKKAAGVYKATAPDQKCSNKECGWAEWPDKDGKAAAPHATPPPKSYTIPAPVTKANAWDEVHALYGRALHEARKVIGASDGSSPDHREMLEATVALGLAVVAALKGVAGAEAPKPARPAPAVGPAFDEAPPPSGPPEDADFLFG